MIHNERHKKIVENVLVASMESQMISFFAQTEETRRRENAKKVAVRDVNEQLKEICDILKLNWCEVECVSMISSTK